MLTTAVQSSFFVNFAEHDRKFMYKRHYHIRNVSQLLGQTPPLPLPGSHVEEQKPSYHTITFKLNTTQSPKKHHSYHARSLTPSCCRRTSPPKKINPYTNA